MRAEVYESLEDAVVTAAEAAERHTGDMDYIEHGGKVLGQDSLIYKRILQDVRDKARGDDSPSTFWAIEVNELGEWYFLNDYRDSNTSVMNNDLADLERDFPDKRFRTVKVAR